MHLLDPEMQKTKAAMQTIGVRPLQCAQALASMVFVAALRPEHLDALQGASAHRPANNQEVQDATAPTASVPTASVPAAAAHAATASWPGAGLGPAAVELEAEDLCMGAAVRDAEGLLAGGLYRACYQCAQQGVVGFPSSKLPRELPNTMPCIMASCGRMTRRGPVEPPRDTSDEEGEDSSDKSERG
jgi:hypothetical protein